MPKIPWKCSNCNADLMVWPYTVKNGNPRFCNQKCRGEFLTGRWTGEKNPNWIGEMLVLECQHCHETFKQKIHSQRFCSKKCADTFRQKKSSYICEQCGNTFEREDANVKSHGGTARFCDLDCMGKWNSEHRAGENSHSWKGGKDRPSAQPEYLSEQYHIRRAREANAPINDFTNGQWEELLAYFDHRCGYCNRKMDSLDREHMTPISRGGNHSLENIIPSCRRCNVRKSDRTLLEFVAFAGLQNA